MFQIFGNLDICIGQIKNSSKIQGKIYLSNICQRYGSQAKNMNGMTDKVKILHEG